MPFTSAFAQDIRYALRGFRKNPVFTVTVVASLALGIGANTAIFSLIYALLLRQLPVHEPQRLVQLQVVEAGRPNDNLSYPIIQALAAERELFTGVGGFSGWTFNSGPPESAERRRGVFVSADYYPMLGVKPALGRLLEPADDQAGAAPAAVITFDHWLAAFNADRSVVGRQVSLDGHPVVIVGVSQPGFSGASVGEAMDYVLALSALPQMFPGGERRLDADLRWIRVLARLAPGVSVEQANARLAVLWPRLAESTLTPSMAEDKRRAVLASSLLAVSGAAGWSNLRGAFREPLYVLLGMVGLVLLIACANAANLFLARAVARAEELSLRRALGATRGRIVRQLLTESVLLALIAAIGGVAMAYAMSRQMVEWIARGRQAAIVLDLRPDPTMLAFTVGLAALTGILFGLLPTLRATALTVDSRTVGVRSGLRSGLVVVQIALSLTLLIGAGLFVGAFNNLSRLDPGFRHEGVLMLGVDARRAGYQGERLAAVYQQLLDELAALPSVAAATLSADTPLTGRIFSDAVSLDDRASVGNDTAQFNRIAPDYFKTLGVGLALGRDFTLRDTPNSPAVAIVNQAFVRRYLGGGSPIGRLVSVSGAPERQNMAIVGVVEDTRSGGLRELPPPSVYIPYFQHAMAGATFSVAASGSLSDTAARMRQVVAARLPSSFPSVEEFSEQVERSLAQERLLASLAIAFALLAWLLALTGLGGLLSYNTVRRRQELGVRMALGATKSNVLGLVLSEAVHLIAIGVVVGLAAAWVVSRWVSSLLFGLTASDPGVILGATGALVAAGLAVAFFPAYRAARADPATALRHD